MLKRITATVVIASSMLLMAACNTSQFDQVLNEVGPAVNVILQIVAIAENKPANTSLATKVSGDVADIEKLYNDGLNANQASAPGIQAQINAEFNVLNSDLTTVFDLAQVKDKNTQVKISSLVALVESGVQIAEAAVAPPNSAARAQAPKIAPSSLVDSFDKVLVAKTGNPAVDAATPKMQLHKHSHLMRVLSLGLAH